MLICRKADELMKMIQEVKPDQLFCVILFVVAQFWMCITFEDRVRRGLIACAFALQARGVDFWLSSK